MVDDKLKQELREKYKCNIVEFYPNKAPKIAAGSKILRPLQSEEEFEKLLGAKNWGITPTTNSSIIMTDGDSKDIDPKFDKLFTRSRRSFKNNEYINSKHGILHVTDGTHDWCVILTKKYHDAGNLELFAENQNMIVAGMYHSKKESDLEKDEKISMSQWRNKDDTVTSLIISITKAELGELFSGKVKTPKPVNDKNPESSDTLKEESDYDLDELLRGGYLRGKRRTSLKSLYIKLRIRNYPINIISKKIKEINDALPEPLDKKEIRQIIASAADYYANTVKPSLDVITRQKESQQEGTIDSDAVFDSFIAFFSQCKDDDNNFKYLDIIDSLGDKNSFLVNTLDFSRSEKDNIKELFGMLCDKPTTLVKQACRAANQIYEQRHPKVVKKIFVMFDESIYKSNILDTLGNKHIAKLVTTEGMVMSMSSKFQIPDRLFYKCPDGHITVIISKTTGDIQVPVVCDNNKCKHRDFENITSTHQDASFEQYRMLTIRSQNEFSLNEDELSVLLSNDLVDSIDIGDNVRITGIIHPTPVNKNGKKNNDMNMFQTLMICSFIENIDKIDYTITDEDIEYFKKFVLEDDFYSTLVNSIAPAIFGMSVIKESLILQRVGGYFPVTKKGKKTREFFLIGVWGSPGMAKTDLGLWCERELPKTKIVHSRGASAKGLLLGLEDSPHGGKSIRAGTMVICQNGGVVILDEYTRLSKETREELFTTMESGFASIAKSGHNAKARADAGIYATGNAFEGEWDKNSTLLENLKMDSAELQRFDFHWIIIDEHDPNHDEKIADIILEQHQTDTVSEPLDTEKKLPVDVLIKYIEYVKRFKPILTNESSDYLKKTYLQLRASSHNKNTSPRILNTLVRTATAIARIHQKNIVEIEDIDKTLTLIKIMLSQQGISIDEADTYLTRQYDHVIQILHNDILFPNGMNVEQIMRKMHTEGSNEDIQQVKMDLGDIVSISTNKKLRVLFGKVKKSRYVKIIQHKPLTLLYKKVSGTMDDWN